MKRIVFISPNRRLIEKITSVLHSRMNIDYQLLSTSRYSHIIHDIAEFETDIVIVDAGDFRHNAKALEICKEISFRERSYKCIMLISSNENEKEFAKEAKQKQFIDGYITLGDSPDRLFDELLEI